MPETFAPTRAAAQARIDAVRPAAYDGNADAISAALKSACRVRSIDEPHLAPWLGRWAACEAAPALFPSVDRRCDSFTQWWTRATPGLRSNSHDNAPL